MKYIIKEIKVKDEMTQEQALAKAKQALLNSKEIAYKEIPLNVIYGYRNKKGAVFFEEPIITKNDEQLREETKKILKAHPNSVLYVLYKHHVMDSKGSVELYYKDLTFEVEELVKNASWSSNWGYSPEDTKTVTIKMDYTYEVPADEVEEELFYYLGDDPEFSNLSDVELEKYIKDHWDELVDKYYEQLKDRFKDSAIDEAEKSYYSGDLDY